MSCFSDSYFYFYVEKTSQWWIQKLIPITTKFPINKSQLLLIYKGEEKLWFELIIVSISQVLRHESVWEFLWWENMSVVNPKINSHMFMESTNVSFCLSIGHKNGPFSKIECLRKCYSCFYIDISYQYIFVKTFKFFSLLPNLTTT